MTYTVIEPFTYEVLSGGTYMPAVIDGSWELVANRGRYVQLQKRNHAEQCSYDGIYLSVSKIIFDENFKAEAEAVPPGRPVVARCDGLHAGSEALGAIHQGRGDRGAA